MIIENFITCSKCEDDYRVKSDHGQFILQTTDHFCRACLSDDKFLFAHCMDKFDVTETVSFPQTPRPHQAAQVTRIIRLSQLMSYSLGAWVTLEARHFRVTFAYRVGASVSFPASKIPQRVYDLEEEYKYLKTGASLPSLDDQMAAFYQEKSKQSQRAL